MGHTPLGDLNLRFGEDMKSEISLAIEVEHNGWRS